MSLNQRIVTVMGGSGFLGTYLTKELCRKGYTVQILCRDPVAAQVLRTQGDVGQVVPEFADITRQETYLQKLEGSHALVNLVGILFERGRQKFTAVHAQGAEKLAQAAREKNVEHYVHVSALGIEKAANSQYAQSKLMGEKATRQALPQAVILRPGILFGPEDAFFNKFAFMARSFGMVPVLGGGKARYQPVYVSDVARAIVAGIERPDAQGKLFELTGPEAYSFSELMKFTIEAAHAKAQIVSLPVPLAALMGRIAGLMPRPFLTGDQVRLSQHDNLPGGSHPGLKALGIEPSSMELIVPSYLKQENYAPAMA